MNNNNPLYFPRGRLAAPFSAEVWDLRSLPLTLRRPYSKSAASIQIYFLVRSDLSEYELIRTQSHFTPYFYWLLSGVKGNRHHETHLDHVACTRPFLYISTSSLQRTAQYTNTTLSGSMDINLYFTRISKRPETSSKRSLSTPIGLSALQCMLNAHLLSLYEWTLAIHAIL